MPETASPSTTADPALARVIAQVESSGQICAVRFEPSVYADCPQSSGIVSKIARLNFCDIQTARVIYSTSYGLYQIMGFNLYGGLGYENPILQFWENAGEQEKMFTQFLNDNEIDFTWKALKDSPDLLRHFAATYNGDAGAYSASMLRAARILGL